MRYFESNIIILSYLRLDNQLELCNGKVVEELAPYEHSKFTSLPGGSFGKASISSGFSIKSGGSDRDTHIDNLLKTIAKDSGQDSVNDANSIRVTINKTSNIESNTDTLKKMSEKPNNQTKMSNMGAAPLSPSLIKCNILKGEKIVASAV